MPYQLLQVAPNLLHVVMSGHVDKDTAEIYHPEAWQKLDSCPKPTHIIMDAREVQSVCPVARGIVDKVRFHPHVGHIVFIVRQRYLLIFSPVLRFFSGFHMFGSEHEALSFLKPTVLVSPTTTSVPVTTSADETEIPVVILQNLPGSRTSRQSTPMSLSLPNPIVGVVSFFSDMFDGMTRKIEDKPSILE